MYVPIWLGRPKHWLYRSIIVWHRSIVSLVPLKIVMRLQGRFFLILLYLVLKLKTLQLLETALEVTLRPPYQSWPETGESSAYQSRFLSILRLIMTIAIKTAFYP